MPSLYLTTLHALSPLHAGTGQGVGVIDLPIAREKATNLPFLPGSSVKGVLRDACPKSERATLFGTEREQSGGHDAHAGQVQLTDLRLLLLPVRSLAGTFAWVSSPYLLERFRRDAESRTVKDLSVPNVPSAIKATQQCLVHPKGLLHCSLNGQQQVVLEDLDLVPDTSGEKSIDEWAACLDAVLPAATGRSWEALLKERLCVVHDDVLDFLLLTATEVRARISIDGESKTVNDGQLWYEELLPTETILAGLMLISPVAKAPINDEQKLLTMLSKLVKKKTLQFGGKATVGYGLGQMALK